MLISSEELDDCVPAVWSTLEAVATIGIIHMDVKPENIVLLRDNTSVLIDWDTCATAWTHVKGKNTPEFASTVILEEGTVEACH